MLMLGMGVGGVVMGRLADRHGVMLPLIVGSVCIAAGYVGAGLTDSIHVFKILHGVVLGLFGISATLGPLMADTSHWWEKRRVIAVAVCASGNYLGGAIWPPILQHMVETVGWRQGYIGMGIFCADSNRLSTMSCRTAWSLRGIVAEIYRKANHPEQYSKEGDALESLPEHEGRKS